MTMHPLDQRRQLLGKPGEMAALGGGNAGAMRCNQAPRSRFDPGETLKPLEGGGSGGYGSELT